ncbi:MAG: PAS domain S-box protein [Gemmatimonadetes bacterium]|nr:PAS domain S-box protein [Gemmatimonadota bacterium]
MKPERWRRTLSAWVLGLSLPARYAIAVGVTGIAALLRVAFDPLWGRGLPFITFYPAVMLVAWLGGFGPGIVATLLSATIADYFWMAPALSLTISATGDVLGLLLFVGMGALISVLNEAWRRATVAQSRSEERLRVTLASIGDAVIATDDQGRVTRLNAVAESLTGWTEVDALGRRLEEVFVIITEDSRRPAENPVGRVLREGVIAGLANHTVLVSKDGREIPVDDSAAPILTADGRVAGVVMVFRDVTSRRQAEQERADLVENERAARVKAETAEQRLRIALEAGRMGTWQWTIGTGEVKWSPGLEAIHGYAPGTFAGTFEAFEKEVYPEDRESLRHAISEALEQRRDHQVEYRIVRADGAVRWVEGRGQLFCDADGRPERMVGVCSDITERKQAEERFRLAIDAAPTAMIMVDQHGTIVLVNALTESLLGYARHELIGQPVDQLVPVRFRHAHPQYRSSFFDELRRRPMGAGRELYARRKDDSEVPVEIGLSPFRTADGVFVLAAVTDITARQQAEHAERAAKRQAEEANRAKDQFLAIVSHELRTPLNAIVGWADMLRKGMVPESRRERAAETIFANAKRQAQLIDELLDISRILSGKLVLERTAIHLRSAVHAAAEAVQPSADAKRIAIAVEADSTIGLFYADPTRLQQILGNLLSNAAKYSEPGTQITVAGEAAGGEVVLSVTNVGPEIPPEELPRLFDRFYRTPASERGGTRGIGLGLYIARGLVEAHGGRIWVESGTGGVTTFRFTLPASASGDGRGS